MTSMLFRLRRLSFLIPLVFVACGFLGGGVSAQTVESLLRAVQERHMALEQRNWVLGEIWENHPWSSYENAWEPAPLEWPHISDAYPADGALNSLTTEQINEILSALATNLRVITGFGERYWFDSEVSPFYLTGSYLQMAEPREGGEVDWNFRGGQHVSQEVNAFGTPTVATLADDLPVLVDRIRRLRYLEWPFVPQRADLQLAMWSESRPETVTGSHHDRFLTQLTNYKEPELSAPFYTSGYAYSFSGTGLDGDEGWWTEDLNFSSRLGLEIRTGFSIEGALAGAFDVVARIEPRDPLLRPQVSVPSGEWPTAYEEFSGLRLVKRFTPAEGEALISFNVLPDDVMTTTSPDYKWTDVIATVDGFVHYPGLGDLPSGTQVSGEWVDGHFQTPGVSVAHSPLSGEVSVIFSPDFEHEVEFAGADSSSAAPGELRVDAGRQMVYLELGRGEAPGSIGFLGIRAERLDESERNLGEVTLLRFFGSIGDFELVHDNSVETIPEDYVELWSGIPRLRQIIGRDLIVEVETIKVGDFIDTGHYRLHLYYRDQNTVGSFQDGAYLLNGTAFKTIDVEGVAADSGGAASLLLTDGAKTIDWAVDAIGIAPFHWKGEFVVRENGTEMVRTSNQDGLKLWVDGALIEDLERSPGSNRGHSSPEAVPWFNSIVANAPGEAARTIVFGDNPAYLRPRVASRTGPGWFWREFDALGRVTKQINQLGDNSFSETWPDNDNHTTEYTYSGNLETVVSHRAGEVNGRSWREWDGLTKVTDIVATDLSKTGPGDSSHLRTVTWWYSGNATDPGAEPWAVRAVRHPDGTATTYAYEHDASTGRRTVTAATGEPNNTENPTAIVTGTETVTIYLRNGVVWSSTTTDIGSGTVIASAVGSDPDTFGRPTRIDFHDGTHITRSYAPDMRHLLTSESDRAGVAATFEHDALGRLRETSRNGVSTTHAWNGASHAATYSPGGYSVAQTTNAFGELQSASNTFEPATTTTVNHTNGTFVHATTESGSGAQRVETFSEDGILVSITGNAVVPRRFVHGTATYSGGGPYGGRSLNYIDTILLTDGGADTQSVTRTWLDGAGRTVLVQTPAATGSGQAVTTYLYNDQGRLASITDPDGVTTLFEYDALARTVTTALDGNGNGQIDYSGGDRVSRTETTFSGGDVIQTTTLWDANGQREIARTLSNPATGQVEQIPYGNAALKTTLTRNLGTRTLTLNGPDGELSLAHDTDWLPTGHTLRDASNTVLASSSLTRDGFGRPASATGSLGGRSISAGWNPDGTPASAALGGRGFSYAHTHPQPGQHRTTVSDTSAGTSRTSAFRLADGRLTERSGYGQFDISFDHTRGTDGMNSVLTTSGGAATTFLQNAAGAATGKTFTGATPGPSTDYTASGRTATISTPATGTTTFQRHPQTGALTGIQYPTGSDTANVAYTPNALGQIESITDASGARTLTYHVDGQLRNENYTAGPLAGIRVERSYDNRNRRDRLRLFGPHGRLMDVRYNYEGNTTRLESIERGNVTATYGYVPGTTRRIETVTHTVGGVTRHTATRGYDTEQRLASIENNPANAPPETYGYSYNAAGKRDTLTLPGGRHWQVGYQSDGQLNTFALRDGTTPVPGYQYAFNHSGIGNRTLVAINDHPGVDRSASWTPNPLNQITSREVPGFVDVLGSVAPMANVTASVRDNSHPVAKKGAWFLTAEYGTTVLHDDDFAKGEKWVDFRFEVPPGTHKVDLIWPAHQDHAETVPVTVRAGDRAPRTRLFNQTANGGTWISHGEYKMAAGGIITVRIATHGTDGRVIADRVRLTRIDPTTPAWSETLSATSAVDVTTVTADRLADLFHLAVPVDNSQGPVNVTVDITGTLPGAGVNGTDAIAVDQVSAIIPPANDAHGHDLDGNRTADWRWDLTWNAAGQLRRMESTPAAVAAGAPDQRITFDYDSQGRRFSKTVEVRDPGNSSFIPHTSSFYIYDGWNLIAEFKLHNSSLILHNSYTWGLDLDGSHGGLGGVGGLIGIRDGSGDYIPAIDGRGNVVALTDAQTGEQVASYAYGAFGELLSATGPAAKRNPLRFSSKYHDAETGLYYFGFRYLDPETGRWLSREPLGELESPNLYAFVGNDPINFIDVLGLYAYAPGVPSTEEVILLLEGTIGAIEEAEAMLLDAVGLVAQAPKQTSTTTGRSMVSDPGLRSLPGNLRSRMAELHDQQELLERVLKVRAITDAADSFSQRAVRNAIEGEFKHVRSREAMAFFTPQGGFLSGPEMVAWEGLLDGYFKETTIGVATMPIAFIGQARHLRHGRYVGGGAKGVVNPYLLEGAEFSVRINPTLGVGPMAVNTSTFTSGARTMNGGIRNSRQFWNQWATTYGDSLSVANQSLIRRGRAPVVDDAWIRAFPEHSRFRGEGLIHHHLDYGRNAIPLPSSVHSSQPGWGIWHPQHLGVN